MAIKPPPIEIPTGWWCIRSYSVRLGLVRAASFRCAWFSKQNYKHPLHFYIAALTHKNNYVHSFLYTCSLRSQKNIQQPGFAGGHPPNY